MINFTVTDTLPRTYRILAEDGTTFSVKKSVRNPDGTFNTPAVNRAYQQALATKAAKKRWVKVEVAWQNNQHIGIDVVCHYQKGRNKPAVPDGSIRVFVAKEKVVDGKVLLSVLIAQTRHDIKLAKRSGRLKRGYRAFLLSEIYID